MEPFLFHQDEKPSSYQTKLKRSPRQPQTSPGTSSLTLVPPVSTQQQQNDHGATGTSRLSLVLLASTQPHAEPLRSQEPELTGSSCCSKWTSDQERGERYPPCGACVANESFTTALHTRLWLGL
ncbi:unnamed protein product [Boreogadus saida]